MILVEDKITAHLHKTMKRCLVCHTKYKKSDITFHRVRLSKKQRLQVRKEVFKRCEYKKKHSLLFRLTIKPCVDLYYYIIDNINTRRKKRAAKKAEGIG